MKQNSFTPYGTYKPMTGIGIAQLRCIGGWNGDYVGGYQYWTGKGWASNKCHARRYTPFKAALINLWLAITDSQFKSHYVLRYYSDGGGNHPLFI
jgi:hypothetical protein